MVHLHSVATAVPDHELAQDFVLQRAREILGPKYPQFERLSKTFATSGVRRRYSVAPIDWFSRPHGWADRNALYLEGAERMFRDAATAALEQAGWAAGEVDILVTLSSTGIATPSLEAQAMGRMGFRDDAQRIPVFGLGCAGGVSGLGIAEAQARANPGAKVLLVVVEVCTVSFRSDRLQKADIIAAVLFGDGAAAACLSTEPADTDTVVDLGRPVQKTWPDTLDIMGWDVDDDGLGVVFDRSIPEFVLAKFAAAVRTALERTGLTVDDIDRFVCHPGGAKVIEAIEATLHLQQGSLDAEREILRDFGNMSAPTVLFVLKAVLDAGTTGRMLACALGPGFTASFLPVTVSRRDLPLQIAAE